MRARSAVSLTVLAVSAALARGQGGPPPANVVLDPVIEETIEQRRPITGRVRALKRSELASKETGLIVELTVEAGDEVEKGEVVARLDDELLALDVERAEADLALAEAREAERRASLERTERDLDRVEQLDDEGSSSPSELDEFRTSRVEASALLAQARAEVVSSRAQLARLKRRLSDMTIRAPFSGEVVSKHTEIGQWLGAGDTVVELVSLDEIEAWIQVPERVAARLRELLAEEPALTLEVRVDALDTTREGRVTRVIADGDPISRLFPVRIALDNTDHALRPGMGVVAETPTKRSAPTLTISKDAVLRDDAGQYVYFNAGGMAQVARIERLFATRDRIAIQPGRLQQGMSVVVRGNERLFPTQPLAPQNAGAGQASATPAGADDAPEQAEGG